jgi:glutamine phosphoribosylpyrophosphate amidotransferase
MKTLPSMNCHHPRGITHVRHRRRGQSRNIVPVLVEGLKRLEYRGYDSCGVAVHQGGALRRTRSTARVAELQALVDADGGGGRHRHRAHALGHARRAGGAQRASALFAWPRRHGLRYAAAGVGPHRAGAQRHHREPRRAARRAEGRGYAFASQTDTEVIAHLVHHLYDGDLLDAVQRACRACAAPMRSPSSAATSRTAWSARAPVRRWCSAWARARTSSPPTPWRWPA